MRAVLLIMLALLVFPAAARADFTVADGASARRRCRRMRDGSSGVSTTRRSRATGCCEAHAEPGGAGHDRAAGRAAQRPVRRRRRARAPPARPPSSTRAARPSRASAPTSCRSGRRGRGCDVYRFALGGARETRVDGVSTGDASEFLPSIWRDRVAFGRVYEQRAGMRGVYPYVYVRGGGPSERQPGGLRGETGLPGPTSLDLAGVRLGLTWGATVNGDFRSDARLDTTTGTHMLLEFTTGQGRGERVVNAFVFAGRVWWAHETDTGPQHEYRRWRIATEKLERAPIPAGRQPTLCDRAAVGLERLLVAAGPRRR